MFNERMEKIGNICLQACKEKNEWSLMHKICICISLILGHSTACMHSYGAYIKIHLILSSLLFIAGVHYKQTPNFNTLSENFRDLIMYSIAINCGYTSRIVPDKEGGGLPMQLGNKTECALLGFLLDLGQSYEDLRSEVPEEAISKVYTFNSVRKSMSTVIPLKNKNGFRLFTKGASEIVLKK